MFGQLHQQPPSGWALNRLHDGRKEGHKESGKRKSSVGKLGNRSISIKTAKDGSDRATRGRNVQNMSINLKRFLTKLCILSSSTIRHVLQETSCCTVSFDRCWIMWRFSPSILECKHLNFSTLSFTQYECNFNGWTKQWLIELRSRKMTFWNETANQYHTIYIDTTKHKIPV